MEEDIQYNLYKSTYTRAFFDFGDVELKENYYKLKFCFDFELENEFVKYDYDCKVYYGNFYPFEILKKYYVKKDNILNSVLNFYHSGGVFDLFLNEKLEDQYYYYPLISWVNYLGDKNLDEEITGDITSISDLVNLEKFTSIKSFIAYKNEFFEIILNKELNLFYNEAVTSNNYSNYINRVVNKILEDFNYFRMESFSPKEDYFSFFSYVLNDLYLTALKNIFQKFENELSDDNRSNIENYIHIAKTKKSCFTLSIKIPNSSQKTEANKFLEIVRNFKNALVSEKFISEIKTSDFKCFIDDRKKSIIKINWTSSLTLLYTFYKQLAEKEIILSSKNEHWKIITKHFIVNGRNIYPHEMVGLKKSTNSESVSKLSQILDNFKNELLLLYSSKK